LSEQRKRGREKEREREREKARKEKEWMEKETGCRMLFYNYR